jgi:deoxyribodipyrimidine photo-lyase
MPSPKPRIHIALFRNDLRLHDQPLLHAALRASPTHLLPLYVFDPRQIDLTALNGRPGLGPFEPARTWHFELPRCAPYKAKFLVESVLALQKSLREQKSDLLIRYGEPEVVVPGLVGHLERETDADVELFLQKEVCQIRYLGCCYMLTLKVANV